MVFITEAEKQTRMENLRNNKRYDLQTFFRDKENYRMEFFKQTTFKHMVEKLAYPFLNQHFPASTLSDINYSGEGEA